MFNIGGNVAYSHSLNRHEILPYLDPPNRIDIETINGQIRCRRVSDTYDDTPISLRVPATEMQQVRRKTERRGARIGVNVHNVFPPLVLPPVSHDHPLFDDLSFLRQHPIGILDYRSGVSRFVSLLSCLRRLFPSLRILVTAVKIKLLIEVNLALEKSGQSALPILTAKDFLASGQAALTMTAYSYLHRPAYRAGLNEFSITGLEPYDFVFVLDPHDWLGPSHNSTNRVAMVSRWSRSVYGVILNRGLAFENELEVLKKYFGNASLAVFAEPRRQIDVWSVDYQNNYSIDSMNISDSVRTAIVQNSKRNELIARVAHELLQNRWPFDHRNDRAVLVGSELIIVALNSAQKEFLEVKLKALNYNTSSHGWRCLRNRYIKIFTLDEFRRLANLRGDCVINADGRGKALTIPTALLRQRQSLSRPLNVIEVADWYPQRDRRLIKRYEQATRVIQVNIRSGGLRRKGRRR